MLRNLSFSFQTKSKINFLKFNNDFILQAKDETLAQETEESDKERIKLENISKLLPGIKTFILNNIKKESNEISEWIN